MDVIAVERGFYGGCLHNVGECFSVLEGESAWWFRPVEAAPAAPEARRKPGRPPRTPAAPEAPEAPAVSDGL